MQMPKGPEIITWALKNVLGNMGIPKDLLDAQIPAQQPTETMTNVQPAGDATAQEMPDTVQ